MIEGLTLDALRAFRVFSEHLNFTRGAELLHISQPALHVKIGELGRALGVALYVKRGRRLELTEKGRELALFAGEMEDRLASFSLQFQGASGPSPVVLAAGQGAYLYLLDAALRTFIHRFPGQLKLLTRGREECLEAVTAGQAHLGVAALETVPQELSHALLARVGAALAVPARHRLARRELLQLTDLEGLTLVVPPPDRPHRQVLGAALQAAGVSWQVGVEAQGWELMLHFVKLGLGSAVINSCCALPRGVVARPLAGLPELTYRLFWRPGYLRPEAQALRELLLGRTEP